MSTTTQALVAHKAGERLFLEQITIDPIRADEALVEMHATGICHTDISCIDGTLPAQFPSVFGHEGTDVIQ